MFSPSPPWLRRAAVLLLVALLATACGTTTADTAGTAEAGTAVTADPGTADAADPTADADADISAPAQNLTDGCATDPAADVDWFPQQASFDVATGISVTYDGNVKVVTIDRPSDAPDVEPYTVAMVQCGTEAGDIEADAVVEVPITGAATYSTTFVQGFELIDRIDAITAHGGLQFVSSEALLAAADAGDVAEVGDQTAPDLEALAAAEPDVILASAGFSGADATGPFAALDIPVVPNASFLETDPLARAEWLKLEAMLLNEEAAGTEVFAQIAADYTELVDLAADAGEPPTVLTNAPFEGTWFVSGGQSYTAALMLLPGGTTCSTTLRGRRRRWTSRSSWRTPGTPTCGCPRGPSALPPRTCSPSMSGWVSSPPTPTRSGPTTPTSDPRVATASTRTGPAVPTWCSPT